MTGRPGVAHHGGVVRRVLHHHAPRAYLDVVAYVDGAQQVGPRPYDHVVAHGRVALAGLFAGAAQSDPLVDGDVLAHLGGLPYDHSGSMVYEQPLAQSRPRVNVDAGDEPPDLRDQARQQGHVALPESVGRSMKPHRVQTRVAGDHFQRAAGGRVPLLDGLCCHGPESRDQALARLEHALDYASPASPLRIAALSPPTSVTLPPLERQ